MYFTSDMDPREVIPLWLAALPDGRTIHGPYAEVSFSFPLDRFIRVGDGVPEVPYQL